MDSLEKTYTDGILKSFFNQLKGITKLKSPGQPLRGIIKGGDTIMAQDKVEEEVCNNFKSIMQDQQDLSNLKKVKNDITAEYKPWKVFSVNDFEGIFDECNFDKSLGDDYFCGTILKQNKQLRDNFIVLALDVLNEEKPMPKYLSTSKLIAITKSSKSEVEIDQVRPICVQSHVTKIFEKVILKKFSSINSDMLNVQDYQLGFKAGESTRKNLTYVIHNILSTTRKRS